MEPADKVNQDLRGLALLVRKGMAAWMRGLCQPCTHTAAISRQSDEFASQPATAAARPERRAQGVEQMLVDILAAMTQANAMAMEGCT